VVTLERQGGGRDSNLNGHLDLGKKTADRERPKMEKNKRVRN
jgi:hypothetical protein